jgi:hypothetical protein
MVRIKMEKAKMVKETKVEEKEMIIKMVMMEKEMQKLSWKFTKSK